MLDTAIYHCQQSAEKAVKGFLVYRDVRVRKTHDIVELSVEATKLTPNYTVLDDGAKRLSEYAVEFRYPGRQLEPTQAEFEQAYQDAAQFLSITLSLIPAEAHPAK